MANKKKTQSHSDPLPHGCSRCNGRPHVVLPGGGAGRCDCERGRALAESDRSRGIKSEVLASPVSPQGEFKDEWR